MPFVTTDDGAKIHFLDTGGEGPAVVLMHGIFVDAEIWEPQARSLAPDYRVISIDARGHGRTEDSGEPFDYWRLALDCWAVVDHLDIPRIVAGGLFQPAGRALLDRDGIEHLIADITAPALPLIRTFLDDLPA